MKDKSLEQLVQHLRKALPKESLPYLDELVLRTQASYVQAAMDLEQKEMPTAGVHKPEDLQHVEQGSLLIASIKQGDKSSYVVARKSWTGDGTNIHLLGDNRENVAPDQVEHFIPVASSYGTLTRDALIVQAKEYRRKITDMQEANRLQNIELDALGYVWCTGHCTGGQFWHTEPQEITPEMISALFGVMYRLIMRGANTTGMHKMQLAHFHNMREKRIDRYIKDSNLTDTVRMHHMKLMAFKEAVAVPVAGPIRTRVDVAYGKFLQWLLPATLVLIFGIALWRTVCPK